MEHFKYYKAGTLVPPLKHDDEDLSDSEHISDPESESLSDTSSETAEIKICSKTQE